MIEKEQGELYVAIFPFYEQLDSDAFRGIHSQIVRFFDERGVTTIDLLPVYAEYSTDELIVNRYDTHPNEFAHEIAATEIARMLNDDRAESD